MLYICSPVDFIYYFVLLTYTYIFPYEYLDELVFITKVCVLEVRMLESWVVYGYTSSMFTPNSYSWIEYSTVIQTFHRNHADKNGSHFQKKNLKWKWSEKCPILWCFKFPVIVLSTWFCPEANIVVFFFTNVLIPANWPLSCTRFLIFLFLYLY